MNTTQTVTPTTYDQARDAGYEHGRNAGSWITDGNTTEATAARILNGYDDGDPEIMDIQPSPLSGEWAGESIAELAAVTGIDLNDDDLAAAYESGYSDGFWDTVQTSARTILGLD